MWIHSIDPIILINKDNKKFVWTKNDNSITYNNLTTLIKKYDLQIGDNFYDCIERAIKKITPIRPEHTEEQKKIVNKPKGLFGT